MFDGDAAIDVMLQGGTADAFQRRLAQEVGRQIGRAMWVSQALVSPWGQSLASATARMLPGSLAAVGRATRIAGSLPTGSRP